MIDFLMFNLCKRFQRRKEQNKKNKSNEMILFQIDAQKIKVDVVFENDDVWLSLD